MLFNKNNNLGEINIYVGRVIPDLEIVFLLKNFLNFKAEEINPLWNYYRLNESENDFGYLRIVTNPELADFIIVPHNYFLIKKRLGDQTDKYISEFVNLSQQYEKKIIVLAMADSDETIDIPNSIIFRFSQYKYKMKDNEVIIPFYLSPTQSIAGMDYKREVFNNPVPKIKSSQPVVGFCGWAGFPSIYRWFTYQIKVSSLNIKSWLMFNSNLRLHQPGIYFRRKAVAVFAKEPNIKTNFVIRKSYSAQKGQNGKSAISPQEAEKEYLQNIVSSDFVLCPKGNGNGSIRFYETLALGRLPILIDTDCVLPLENVIDYKQFMIQVDWQKIADATKKTIDYFEAMSPDDYRRRQEEAQEAFEKLRPVNLFKHYFTYYLSSQSIL